MDVQTHMIQKAVLLVKLLDRKKAVKQQQQISMLFKDQMMNIISSVFDEVCPKDQTIHIDTLEVELGMINLNDFDAILKRFQEIFTQKITEYYQESKVETKETNQHIFEQFLKALSRGYFSWNVGFKGFSTIMESLLTISWKEQWVINLVHNLQNKTKSFKRLLLQSSTVFLERVEAEIIKQFQIPENTIKQIQQQFQKESEREKIEFVIAYILFEYLTQKSGEPIINAIKEEEAETTKMLDVEKLEATKETLKATKGALDLNEESKHIQTGELIPVANAGIVLLNPVITTIFQRVDLLHNHQFIDIKCQEKAVFIMHYLATGSLELDEAESTLYKILCGINSDHPIPKTQQLSNETIELCKEAIESVIHEWKALKNTGIEGLRENFIKRDGNLKDNGDAYNLDVNQEAVDIILNYSPPPWTVGIIKLPWMEKVLYVNWF